MLAVSDWVHNFLILLPFLIGALMYHYVLWRSRLVPRRLSARGLVGAAMSLVATVYCGFVQEFGFTTVDSVLNIPIAPQELVFAVWLIAGGFGLSSAPSTAAMETTSHERDVRYALLTQA